MSSLIEWDYAQPFFFPTIVMVKKINPGMEVI